MSNFVLEDDLMELIHLKDFTTIFQGKTNFANRKLPPSSTFETWELLRRSNPFLKKSSIMREANDSLKMYPVPLK